MKKVFTISIDPKLFDGLETVSKLTGVSRSRLVCDAIQNYLDERGGNPEREAL